MFAIEPPEQIDDLRLRDWVESAGGLVRNNKRRPVQKGERDQHTLGLPDTDLRRSPVQEFGVGRELHFGKKLLQPGRKGGPSTMVVSFPRFFEVAL